MAARASATAIATAVAFFSTAMLVIAADAQPKTVPNAVPVGSQQCLTCHDATARSLTPAHAAAFPVARAGTGCESCHGPGSTHAESADRTMIVNRDDFAGFSAAEKDAACLSCHKRTLARWKTTEHATAGVSCWDCHSDQIHVTPTTERRVLAQQPLARCQSCHADVVSDFRLQYRHPVDRGTMSCASCHDLHGTDTWRATSIVRDTCTSCHSSVAGPWVFEHEAVDDGCVTCHRPHGSVNKRLLTEAGNALCLKCHAQSTFPAVGKTVHNYQLAGGGLCTDCHAQVHGSNTDENLNPRFH